MVSHPLRIAWHQADLPSSGSRQLPMLLSATITLSLATFFTVYANPLSHPVSVVHREVVHIALERDLGSILLQTAVLMGIVLLLVRRWGDQLVAGTFTLLFGLNGLGIAVFVNQFQFVPAMVGAGLVADGIYRRLEPTSHRRAELYAFSGGVPLVLYSLYFASVAWTDSIAWTIHLRTGAIVLAGITGLLLVVLVVPGPPTQRSVDSFNTPNTADL